MRRTMATGIRRKRRLLRLQRVALTGTRQCLCSSFPFPPSIRCWCISARSPIRWYALAYIVGILLGWVYARALIAHERLWGGPAPLTLVDFDDFVSG